jgi:uncharacterized protein (TIGR02246 family)
MASQMASFGNSMPTTLDEQAIQAVLRGYGEAWNRHDMKALAELFTDDAHWINIVGMHWPGKAAVVRGHEAFHRTFFQTTDIELAESGVRAVAPGVAAAVVLLKVGPFTPPDGIPRSSAENLLSLVLTKHRGQWRIAHGHNTVIDPGAQRFDPVKTGWPTEGRNST